MFNNSYFCLTNKYFKEASSINNLEDASISNTGFPLPFNSLLIPINLQYSEKSL